MELAREFACALTGTDCEATAAWLHAELSGNADYDIASGVWDAANNDWQERLGALMGFCDGSAKGIPARMAARFTDALNMAAAIYEAK